MNLTWRSFVLVAALVLFIIAAILAFGWFGTNASLDDVLGVEAIGFACFTGAHVGP